ncbi:MAG: hypothetical protein RI897_4171 [Verrucomicrobiota bacterium]
MKTEGYWRGAWQRSTTRRFVLWAVSWRTLRRCLVGVASVLTLFALVIGVINWRGGRAWRAHLAELQARGETVEIAKLAPSVLPEGQNMADLEPLRSLFDLKAGEAKEPGVRERLSGFKAPGRNARGNPPECKLGSLQYDCWTDLAACVEFYRDLEEDGDWLGGDSDVARLDAYLARYAEDLAEVRTAVEGRAHCRFPVEYDADMPFSILLPHLAPLKGAGGILGLRAIVRLEEGRVEEAFQDVLLGFRLSAAISEEPILISHLVRIATLSLDLQVVREGMKRGAWSDDQLGQIAAELAGMDLVAEGHRAMAGERAFGVGTLEYFRQLGWWRGEKSQMVSLGDGTDTMEDLMLRFMPDGFYYQNMLKISELHEQFTIGVYDVAGHRIKKDVTDGFDEVFLSMPTRPSTIFVKMLMPALSKATLRTAHMQTLVDAGMVACGVERCRMARGVLPERLEVVVPDYLAAVPKDVISGEGLKYVRSAGGEDWVVYGVGWNSVDDGGVVGWEGEGAKAKVEVGMGDWVWRVSGKR